MRKYIILKGKETWIKLEIYENILAIHLGNRCELRGNFLFGKPQSSYQL